jgi:hypothetical protein
MTLFYNWKNDLNIRPLTLSLIPAMGSYIEPSASSDRDMLPLLRVAGVSPREEQVDLICEHCPRRVVRLPSLLSAAFSTCWTSASRRRWRRISLTRLKTASLAAYAFGAAVKGTATSRISALMRANSSPIRWRR